MKQKKRARRRRGHPWYRDARDVWVFRLPGSQTLHPVVDGGGRPVRGAGNEREAVRWWGRMMDLRDPGAKGDDNLVRDVLELYLQDAEKRVQPRTFREYRRYFLSFLANGGDVTVRELTPKHVRRWWEAETTWGDSVKAVSLNIIVAALNWAAARSKGGAIITSNPLRGMSRPTIKRRASRVAVDQSTFETVMERVLVPETRDIMTVIWYTGMRPIMACRTTAANVTDGGRVLTFDGTNTPKTGVGEGVHKTYEKTGQPLRIILPDPAHEVVTRLARLRPAGPLFRTSRRRPWNPNSVSKTIGYYAELVGLRGTFVGYSARHSMATRILENGGTAEDAAAVLGNSAAIINRHYSHLTANTRRLLGIASRARGLNAEPSGRAVTESPGTEEAVGDQG